MCELNIRYIKRNRLQFFRLFQNLIKWNINNFRFIINKPPDQPGTCQSVNLWSLTGDPFHVQLQVEEYARYTESSNP